MDPGRKNDLFVMSSPLSLSNSNYNLTPVFVESKQLHIYHGVARENQLDNRFFIRTLVRPGRVCSGISMPKYLISETDRLVTSILNSLEVVSAKHRSADFDHISINFIYKLPVTYSDVFGGYFWFHRTSREGVVAITCHWA
jgi:Acetyl-CoA carboxylase, central region